MNKFIKRSNYKAVIVIGTVLLLGIVITVISIISGIKSKNEYVSYDLSVPAEREENAERAQKAKYVTETVYDGADVPYILYDWEFIPEEEKQIDGNLCYTNKELVDAIGEERVQEYVDVAKAYYQLELGNNADTIAADTDAFINKYLELRKGCASVANGVHGEEAELENSVGVDVLASQIAQMYVDNGLSLKTEVVSDKSLVYMKEYYYYVRGQLKITPISSEHKKGEFCQPLYEQFGIYAKYGEETEVFFEVEIEPNKDKPVAVSNIYQPKQDIKEK